MNLNDALKYTTTEINAMLPKIAEGGAEAQAGHHHRLVAADAFSDAGREAEARLLRSEHPVYVYKGKVYQQHGYEGDLRQFQRGHKDAAYFASSVGEGGESPNDYGYRFSDLHPDTHEEMDADAQHFFHSYAHLLPANGFESNGADFYFSRNGHGTGFFDAENVDPEHRPVLQKAAAAAGEYDLYHNPDDPEYPLGGQGGTQRQWGQPEGLPE